MSANREPRLDSCGGWVGRAGREGAQLLSCPSDGAPPPRDAALCGLQGRPLARPRVPAGAAGRRWLAPAPTWRRTTSKRASSGVWLHPMGSSILVPARMWPSSCAVRWRRRRRRRRRRRGGGGGGGGGERGAGGGCGPCLQGSQGRGRGLQSDAAPPSAARLPPTLSAAVAATHKGMLGCSPGRCGPPTSQPTHPSSRGSPALWQPPLGPRAPPT